MHEMSLVHDVVDVVLEQCEGTDVSAVTSVRLTIGELMDVVTMYIPELFRYLARGTIAQDAEVMIERSSVRARCDACGEIFPLDVNDADSWRCPRCDEQKYGIFTGNEFRIDRITVKTAA